MEKALQWRKNWQNIHSRSIESVIFYSNLLYDIKKIERERWTLAPFAYDFSKKLMNEIAINFKGFSHY